MKRLLLLIAILAALSGVSFAQFIPEFFQTTTQPWAESDLGNVSVSGTWLTAEVQVTQGFWTTDVAITITLEDKDTACVTHEGDCASTNTYDIGLRCVTYCPHPGQLVVNTGPLVICAVRTVSVPPCAGGLANCTDAGGTDHCPYATPFNYASIYPWKQGRTWIPPGVYAEETGSSNLTPNNTARAQGETDPDEGGAYGNSQLRLWQTHTTSADGQYMQDVGFPQSSSLAATKSLPPTEESYAHVVTLTMW